MSQVALNLNFPLELVLHVALDELTLVHHLEGNDVAACFFPGKVDMAKLATAERLAYFKVFNLPITLKLNVLPKR
jgi:hypothetical protein